MPTSSILDVTDKLRMVYTTHPPSPKILKLASAAKMNVNVMFASSIA